MNDVRSLFSVFDKCISPPSQEAVGLILVRLRPISITIQPGYKCILVSFRLLQNCDSLVDCNMLIGGGSITSNYPWLEMILRILCKVMKRLLENGMIEEMAWIDKTITSYIIKTSTFISLVQNFPTTYLVSSLSKLHISLTWNIWGNRSCCYSIQFCNIILVREALFAFMLLCCIHLQSCLRHSKDLHILGRRFSMWECDNSTPHIFIIFSRARKLYELCLL